MNHFFSNYDDNDDINEKISLDELYDRKHEVEVNRMNIYKRILQRVHTRIKMSARQKDNQGFTYFVVPEFIFGIPKYNVETCISYMIEKLQDNGFKVKYTHPNLLYIFWGHYIPSYRRAQIKKETGKNIDGFGNVIENKKEDKKDVNSMMLNKSKEQDKPKSILKKSGDYKDVSTYKPQGIYNLDLISKIKDKLG